MNRHMRYKFGHAVRLALDDLVAHGFMEKVKEPDGETVYGPTPKGGNSRRNLRG
jgi:hypothetical protein